MVALARETPLDAYYKWAQIFALVATPFLVAMVGAVATWSTKEAEVAVKYVQLASDILKPEPDANNEHQKALRRWACELMNAYAKVRVNLDACIGAPLIAEPDDGDRFPPKKPTTDKKHCPVHLAFGTPSQNFPVIFRETYAFSFDKDTGTAAWAAYSIGRQRMPNTAVPRNNDFFLDPDLKDVKVPGSRLYFNNEFDRGHLIRRLDVTWAVSGPTEGFYYSVVVPQHKDNNQGVWADIEDLATNALISGRVEELWIASGPIHSGDRGRYRGLAVIPNKLFRIYFDPNRKRVVAFIAPNDETSTKFKGKPDELIVTLDEIERQTGMRFLASTTIAPIELRRIKSELGTTKWLRE